MPESRSLAVGGSKPDDTTCIYLLNQIFPTPDLRYRHLPCYDVIDSLSHMHDAFAGAAQPPLSTQLYATPVQPKHLSVVAMGREKTRQGTAQLPSCQDNE